jgi:uncharacterized protein
MAERPGFQARQYAFAAHIRDPENVAVPSGIDERRMAVYRQLFFNNLRNLLGNMFPVLRKLHDDARWGKLIRGFMRSHRARTPYFLQLPREFLDYLENEHEHDGDYPFLVELARYEYLELEVSIEPESDDPTTFAPDGDLIAGVPLLTVASRVEAWGWPVHRISASYVPELPLELPVFLAVFRGQDDRVRFLELNPLTAELVRCIGDNAAGRSGLELLSGLAADSGYSDMSGFVTHGRTILEELRDAGLVIGARVGD